MVLVDIDGRVKKLFALNNLGADTRAAAVDAAMKSTFIPAQKNGKDVAVWIKVPYRFKGR